jgi:hypothetical protein
MTENVLPTVGDRLPVRAAHPGAAGEIVQGADRCGEPGLHHHPGRINVEDEVGVRAKMFLDTLSKGVHRLHLQSEFDINENTLNYIDKQLEEVTVILEQHEDELQLYKENKDILDLTREENLLLQRNGGLRHKVRAEELASNPSKHWRITSWVQQRGDLAATGHLHCRR